MAENKPPSPTSDADLLAALSDERPRGGSKEMAKKLVKMNPRMKPEGLNTAQAADKLLEAMEQAKHNVAGRAQSSAGPAPPGAGAAPAPVETATLTQAIALAKRRLDEGKLAIAAERKSIAEAREALDRQARALDARAAHLPEQICDAFIDQLHAIDPNMTSPKTNVVLKSEAAFLSAIHFSIERAVAREGKK